MAKHKKEVGMLNRVARKAAGYSTTDETRERKAKNIARLVEQLKANANG